MDGDVDKKHDEENDEGDDHLLHGAGGDGLFGDHFPKGKADVATV